MGAPRSPAASPRGELSVYSRSLNTKKSRWSFALDLIIFKILMEIETRNDERSKMFLSPLRNKLDVVVGVLRMRCASAREAARALRAPHPRTVTPEPPEAPGTRIGREADLSIDLAAMPASMQGIVHAPSNVALAKPSQTTHTTRNAQTTCVTPARSPPSASLQWWRLRSPEATPKR